MLQHTARATYCTIQYTSCISVQTYAIGTFHYIFQRDSTTTVPASTYADAYRPYPLLRSACPVGQSYSLLWEHLSIIHTGTYYVRYVYTYIYIRINTGAVTNDNWQLQLVKREIQTRKCTYAILCTPYVYVQSTVEWTSPPVTGDST
jgi:hypothetical protein